MMRFTTITIAALSLSVVICSPALAERPSINLLNAEVNQLQAEVSELQAENECRDARFQLVGFTTATFLGDAGVLGLTLGCQAEFTESRMCTSNEVMETSTVPMGVSGRAWVRPEFRPSSYSTGGSSGHYAMDASGIAADVYGLHCSGWNHLDTNGYGLSVDASGRFRPWHCSSPISVACCALVP